MESLLRFPVGSQLLGFARQLCAVLLWDGFCRPWDSALVGRVLDCGANPLPAS